MKALRSVWKQSLIEYAGLLAVLVMLVLIFGIRSDRFIQVSTFVSIANQIPALIFVSVGMTWVLIIGGIDLSVGSMLALGSAVVGFMMVDHGFSMWLALAACLLVTSLCGFCNGVISFGLGIPSFIVTLGMLEIVRGLTKLVTNSQTKFIGSRVEPFGEPLAWIQLSPAFLAAFFVVMFSQWVLTHTVFGRYCIAIGTNREAVRMSGVRSAPYSISVFVISGFLCGLAGLAHVSRLSSSDPNAGVGMELLAIAACVIGGTSLMGGRGSVICTFLGVLIIAVLQSGLAQLGVTDANKQIITGAVIILAVSFDVLRSKWVRNGPFDET
ncbi:MAG: ABC transporter permease [Planctomycetota bacterium]